MSEKTRGPKRGWPTLLALLAVLAVPLIAVVPEDHAGPALAAGSRARVLTGGEGSESSENVAAGESVGAPTGAQTRAGESGGASTGAQTRDGGSGDASTGAQARAGENGGAPTGAQTRAGEGGPSDLATPSGDLAAAEPASEPVVGPDGYLVNGWLIWDELSPADWDPAAIFDELGINDLSDDDPRVDEIIEEFIRRWNDAPVNPSLDGLAMRIPGFVVPLDLEAEAVAEFFLVPFFGACIHVPPPPPNQIVLVRPKEPIKGLGAMEVVEVYGRISLEGFTNEMGRAGYAMAADKVEPYRIPEEDG